MDNSCSYIVPHSSTGSEVPDEFLVMDAPSIEDAVRVLRWNKSGLSYSLNGYNGDFIPVYLAVGRYVFREDYHG